MQSLNRLVAWLFCGSFGSIECLCESNFLAVLKFSSEVIFEIFLLKQRNINQELNDEWWEGGGKGRYNKIIFLSTEWMWIATVKNFNAEVSGVWRFVSLWRMANARNFSFETLHGGQFTILIQLIKPNYVGIKRTVFIFFFTWVKTTSSYGLKFLKF